jgi:hypothetical protein
MPQAKESIELKLDHFKVYKQYYYAEQRPLKVQLQGQFDQAPVAAEIDHMLYFATPVSKNNSPIVDKNAHLAFYGLHGPKERRRVVVLKNQFGLQKLLIGPPLYLLVPSQKVEEGSVLPTRLDHYKAYQVLEGQMVDRTVVLADQVDRQDRVEVTKPVLFCVPVVKTVGTKTSRIVNAMAHLTFYAITPRRHRVRKTSKDQFGEHQLVLATSVFLGAPTVKLDYQNVG